MTVASRIVKLESQITYLERKLDHLINVYRKDQQRLKRNDTACSNDDDINNHTLSNQHTNNRNNIININNNAGINGCNNNSNNGNNDNTSSNNSGEPVCNLLAPLYQREGVNKSTLSMSLLSPDIPGRNSMSDRKIKNRSSSQPASMENLRSISDAAQSATGKSFSSKQSGIFRPTNIKIPAFFDKLPNKFQWTAE